MVTVYRNSDHYTRSNVRVAADGRITAFDKTRTAPGLNGVEIGYAIVDRSVLNLESADTAAMFEDVVYPTLASRVEEANKRVKDLPPAAKNWLKPPVADDAEFARLKARASQLAKSTPDDTTLANSQQLLQALPRSCIIPYTTQDELTARKAIAAKANAAQSSGGEQAKKKKKHPTPPPADSASATPAAPANQVISSPH